MLKYFTLVLISSFFLGCGETSQEEPHELKKLYFGEPATNGIHYQCGERKGISKTIVEDGIKKHGVMSCIYSPITLSLGSLTLGELKKFSNHQTIYPQSLIEGFDRNFNNPEVLKIAILLQSLDDKEYEDHINIPPQTQEKITLESLSTLSIEELYQEIEKMGFTPVSAEEAKIHLILNSKNSHTGSNILSF